MAFEFLVKLENQMSGPAAEAQSSIDKLTAAIRKLQAQQLRMKVNTETFGGVFPPTASQKADLLRADRMLKQNERDAAKSLNKKASLERQIENEQLKFRIDDATAKEDAVARRREIRQQRFWKWQAAEEKRQNSFKIGDTTAADEKALRAMGVAHSRAFDLDRQLTRKRGLDQIAAHKTETDAATKEEAALRKMTLEHIKALELKKKLEQGPVIQGKKVKDEGSGYDILDFAAGSYVAGKSLSIAESVVGTFFNALRATWDRMVPAISVREQGRLGFRHAFGAEGADWATNRFDEMSRQMGRPADELFQQGKEFGNIGASKEESNALTLSISDMKVMGGEAGKLETAYEQMFSQPILNIRAFKGTLTGVVDESKLWLKLAKDIELTTGKKTSVAQANWLVSHKYISGQMGAQALKETIQDQEGGALGNSSLERAKTTFDGIAGRFNASIDSMLGKLGQSEGWKEFLGAFDNLVIALQDSKVQGKLEHIANLFGDMFKSFDGGSGLARVESFFDRLDAILTRSITGIERFLAVYDLLPWVPHPFNVAAGVVDMVTTPDPEKPTPQGGLLRDYPALPPLPGSKDSPKVVKHEIKVESHLHIHGNGHDHKALQEQADKAHKETIDVIVQKFFDHLNDQTGGDQK